LRSIRSDAAQFELRPVTRQARSVLFAVNTPMARFPDLSREARVITVQDVS
jgi:hypothetical protein